MSEAFTDTPCSEWAAYRNAGGYGVLRVPLSRQTALAHRVAYCKAHGLTLADIRGLVVRHKCDNRACVATDHLLLGSQADNVKDMVSRGRRRPTVGADHPGAKLTDANVVEIRSSYVMRSPSFGAVALAQKFGVTRKQIVAIVFGRAWNTKV